MMAALLILCLFSWLACGLLAALTMTYRVRRLSKLEFVCWLIAWPYFLMMEVEHG